MISTLKQREDTIRKEEEMKLERKKLREKKKEEKKIKAVKTQNSIDNCRGLRKRKMAIPAEEIVEKSKSSLCSQAHMSLRITDRLILIQLWY